MKTYRVFRPVLWIFLLLNGSALSSVAQTTWKAVSDSSNTYFAKQDFEKAYAFSLEMIKEAEPLHARDRNDTTLVTSLVRASVSQRLAPRPDTTKGLAHATRALRLLTPTQKPTFLGASVYSLNAIFTYMAGQHEQALQYAELAADRLEKLRMTASSPYWEVQRYRVVIYREANDTASIKKAVAVLRQTLPVTARTFGKGSSQYYALAQAWGSILWDHEPWIDKHIVDADSVWESFADATQRRTDAAETSIVNVLNHAANYYALVGRLDKAIAFAARRVAKAEALYDANSGHDTTLINSLIQLSNYQSMASQLHAQEALKQINRARALLKPAYELKPWVVQLYALSGRLSWNVGDRLNALAHSQRAVELATRSEHTNNVDHVQAQLTIASIYALTRDKDSLTLARQILEPLVPIAIRVSGRKSQLTVMAMGMLGTAYMLSMPLDDSTQHKADQLWRTLIPLTRELGNRVELCRMLNGMGEYYFARNQPDSARIALRESIDIGKTLPNPMYKLIAQSNLLTLETSAGHYAEAVRLADELMAAPEIQRLPQMWLTLTVNAIDGNRLIGRLDRAETLARQAMHLTKTQYGTSVNYFYATALGTLGMVRYDQGDFSNATLYMEEALGLLEKTARPDNPSLSRLNLVLGELYTILDGKKALQQYQKARWAIEQQQNYERNPDYLSVLRNQMVLLRKLNRLTESVQLADSTIQLYARLSVDDQDRFPLFLQEAFYTYHQAGRRADADSIRRQLASIAVTDKLSLGAKSTVLNTVGTAHQVNGDYSKAIWYFSEGIRTGQILHGNSNNIDAYIPVRMALCHLNLGNRPEGLRLLTESVDRLRRNVAQNLWYMSESQRESYLTPYVLPEIYGMAFQMPSPKGNELILAYTYRLLMQGALFTTSRTVMQAAISQPDTLLRRRVQRLLTIRKAIAQYSFKPNQYVNLDSLRALSDQLEKQIGHFAGTIRQQIKAVTWQDIRKRLNTSEAAVEIIRFNRWAFDHNPRETDTVHYAALIVRPEWSTPRLVLLPNGNAMESDWLPAYRSAMTEPEPNGAAYRRFWQPIAELLQGVQKAFIAADGIYHLISLPTLYNAPRRRFLADELQIVLLGSTRELTDQPEPHSASASVLLGRPAYQATRTQLWRAMPTTNDVDKLTQTRGDLAFADLPATEAEVKAVAQLLSGAHIKARVITGMYASEPMLKATVSPQLLHIATHGYFRPDTLNPFHKLNRMLACGLALAGAADTTANQQPNDDDGILTGYEASLLNLRNTELVTLSACETGVGDAMTGEGVFGLQRAFRLAGARSILMSLWRVDDQLTQQLMTDFYRYWLAGASKPQALRRAQANIRRHFSNPYHWGAFVLLGQ